jgi:hypothetical protein
MKLSMDIPKAVSCDVRVNLGRADARVTEEFLDDPEVRAVIEQVCGEAMSKHVRRYVARDSGSARATLDPKP